MSETTSRVLQLLGLLQSRRVCTGEELAERLAVTTRSVRRDVERLRELGYPVHASKGHGGGYQLGAGAALPPLLHNTVGELEATCDERRQLRDQKRLHHWLHGWLLLHIPLSLALLLLGTAHAVIALRY